MTPSYLSYRNLFARNCSRVQLNVVIALFALIILFPDGARSQTKASTPLEVDTATIAELAPLCREEVDEFEGITWITPKYASHSNKVDDIYAYFCVKDGKPYNLRLRIQIVSSDWLFVKKYIFLIDGKRMEYTPARVERDFDSITWEWSDEKIKSSPQLKALFAQMLKANEIKMRFVGKNYVRDRTLTSKEVAHLKEINAYFNALTPRRKASQKPN